MPKQPVPANAERVRRHAHVNEEGPSSDVFARQKSPVAAVVGFVAIVAHHPVMVRRDDDGSPVVCGGTVVIGIATDVVWKLQCANLATVLVVRYWREGCVQRVRLVETLAV